ncbi:MAG TPA: hypothetical protein VGX25_31365 [Actinophytocola sp.]|uniref:hypothetical protein n=1 Tax=Actinophytocola sp. TaxID=1872138 RepID=UPI002DDCEE25|nr:hypothetical protein [Actinophytocola sp.]HEV2783909.1 hypothetical protein [Actinophytocola sp.]
MPGHNPGGRERGLGVGVDALAEAEAAGLIRVADGRVEFRHPVVRAAVYGDAAPEHRRSVHRAVADALGPHEPDRRAWHLAQATLGPDARIAELLAEAAAGAHDRGAHDVAAAAFERAARLSPDVEAQARMSVAAGESACSTPSDCPIRTCRPLPSSPTPSPASAGATTPGTSRAVTGPRRRRRGNRGPWRAPSGRSASSAPRPSSTRISRPP